MRNRTITIETTATAVRVLLGNRPVFEYRHPHPDQLLANITATPTTYPGSRGRSGVIVDYGTGWFLCNTTSMRRLVVHPDLQ